MLILKHFKFPLSGFPSDCFVNAHSHQYFTSILTLYTVGVAFFKNIIIIFFWLPKNIFIKNSFALPAQYLGGSKAQRCSTLGTG